ncbi:MAG: thiamine pyrophosphate-binding protein [Actinobacteria bacterium]|nr:thiamine pyrophosphate-binding protein [Actinomycetota bacterium]MBU1944904.1 thiamine pyrophosphate-binding protein [Actinomycetota bacterium]MBU2688108.1 thiamine pyrophosphate-binding protein [Actinomycetota bacterium]
MRLTGGEIVAEYLIAQGVPYVAGIPGHGCLGLADAFLGRESRITVLKVMQEMSGVHLADGYYRASGRPLAVFTSIGPGAINTAIGAGTAFADSTAVLILTGSAHTHMRGKGLLQELERTRDDDFASVLAPVVKRSMRVDTVEQLPGIMKRAFNVMMTGRRGPVNVVLPMDVQCAAAEVRMPRPFASSPRGRPEGDGCEIEKAARLLAGAKRPVILAGGGVAASGAQEALSRLAELKGAAVVTTMAGKGCFPEDHPLYAWHTGSKGTSVGLEMTSSADVLLAVGCRFADETSCSYRYGVAFAIPPTKLIHVDIDPYEIGKNYPVEVGIQGDAAAVLEQMACNLEEIASKRDITNPAFVKEIAVERKAWEAHVARLLRVRTKLPTISQVLHEIRGTIARDAFLVTSSGNTQAQMLQEFGFYVPGTCITTGGFSTMGFTLPATIGVKLAQPDRQVVGLVGDGDFMMTMQEMATAVMADVPVTMVVVNNQGWLAIKDLQMDAYGEERAEAVDFERPGGGLYEVDCAAAARAFGWNATRVDSRSGIGPALKKALASGRPSLVEVVVHRRYPYSGSPAVGWWDVPVPAYLKKRRAAYEKARSEERLT